MLQKALQYSVFLVVVVVVVVTPSLFLEIKAQRETILHIHRLIAPPLTRRTAVGGNPKVASYDILGKHLHYSNLAKHGY